MRVWKLAQPGERLSVLCLGAHSDDIEIGAGGTLLAWIAAGVALDVHWCVLSAPGPRAAEARTSAAAFLAGAANAHIEIADFKDGYFPYEGGGLKLWIESLKARVRPDVILTHRHDDAHQDHRELCRLTWNAFRDHLILEYEIPKWDGDMGRPNLYVALPDAVVKRKIELLLAHFGTQRSKDWFDPETFRGLARLRGMECRAPERYAEAFLLRKARLG
ncbi:PIG-L deacetylase family protein [Chelatococcus sp. SYSU_G07232]|uniref:PIG-L deacetylase family protein n=1 Tax=Chelatococcus albus TaxID=3047466 RepID=A0ABT7ACJ6_9HYPH|nr:PIG-L deacetylase family protein [Chelatococcus sp. SYSU_G07232]MDJ1157094.1 PIG-L deacetylase family protein [Chelatococcus sp. SYSU_G07232]